MPEENEGNQFRSQGTANEQNSDRSITAENFKRYFETHKSNFQDSALDDIINPKKWWGLEGRLKTENCFDVTDGENKLSVNELNLCPQYDNPQDAFILAKKQHIVIINFETKQKTEKLQNIRIKYFYYLCKKLRKQTNNWNISVQDAPSGKAERRRKLKIFFGYSDIKRKSETSDDDFKKWIELFDEVYNFLDNNKPSKEDLNEIPMPDYTSGWKACGPLEGFCQKTYNANMNTDTEKKDKIEARNCIWAGAPGTGKSFKLNQAANIQFEDKTMRVTFHPEYTYYDFVGTYRPRMAKNDEGNTMGKIEYAFVPGPFAKMLKKALWNRNANYCLIIEEINRANAAAVFGDVFQLLDRASQNSKDGSEAKHESEYAICPSEELYEYLMNEREGNKEMPGTRPNDGIMNELRLPDNLYIWATMNSADQGVFPMDTAFKRRWSFENMAINPSEGQDPDYDSKSAWDKIRRGINDMLLKHHVQEDKLMGYYFLKKEERDSKENLEKALKEKVLLYLFEDAAKPFRGKIFKNEYNTCEKLRGKLVVDDPNLGVFLEKVWDGIPQQSKPEDTKQATEDVDNDDNP